MEHDDERERGSRNIHIIVLHIIQTTKTVMSDTIAVYREEYLAIRFAVVVESFIIFAYIVHKLVYHRHHIHHHAKMAHYNTKKKIRDLHYNTKLHIAKARTRLKVARALNSSHDFDARLKSPPQPRRIPGNNNKVAPAMENSNNNRNSPTKNSPQKDNGSPTKPSPVNKIVKQSDHPWYIAPSELKLRMKKPVAKGTFGCVYIGEWLGLVVTVKEIEVKNDQNNAKCKASLKAITEEIHKLSEIRHPNIVIFLGACVSPKCYIVMEHCAHGTLKKWMAAQVKESIPVDMKIVLDFLSDIARGVRYAHEKYKMIVRNLQSSKIFIDEHLQAKISVTFGMSHKLSGFKDDEYPAWSAPEILRGEDYNEKVDVFSFAIVMWELLTRLKPYADVPELKKFKIPHEAIAFAVAKHEMRPEVPEWCPKPLETLMMHCWSDDSYARPDFNGIIQYLNRMKKAKEVLAAHDAKYGPKGSIKSIHSPVNYHSPPGTTAKKQTYVKGPTKIPTPGGYIILHTS